jgi:hypothetical protein
MSNIIITDDNLKYKVPKNADADADALSMKFNTYYIIQKSTFINSMKIEEFDCKKLDFFKIKFTIVEINGYFCLKFSKLGETTYPKVYNKLSTKLHYINNIPLKFYEPINIPNYNYTDKTKFSKYKYKTIQLKKLDCTGDEESKKYYNIDNDILKYLAPLDKDIKPKYLKKYIFIKKTKLIKDVDTLFAELILKHFFDYKNMIKIFQVNEQYYCLDINSRNKGIIDKIYESLIIKKYLMITTEVLIDFYHPVAIPFYHQNDYNKPTTYETIELQTFRTIKDNIFKYMIPLNTHIKPLYFKKYIIIKNSLLFDNAHILIGELILKHFFEYKSVIKIVNIDEYYCMEFNETSGELAETLYEHIFNKLYFINDILIDFYKPIKIPFYNSNIYINEPTKYDTIELKTLENKLSYVFIDNSNIIYTAQKLLGLTVKTTDIIKVLEKDKKYIEKRDVVGSGMTDTVIETWETNGYTVNNSPPGPEFSVDEILHSKLMNIIINNKQPEKSNLILATGDGNNNKGSFSFPSIVMIALEKGWTVDLYSWKISLSNNFNKIINDKFKIHLMDEEECFKIQMKQCVPKQPTLGDFVLSDLQFKPKQIRIVSDIQSYCNIHPPSLSSSHIFIDSKTIHITAINSGYNIQISQLKNAIERYTDQYSCKTRYTIGQNMPNYIVNQWEYLQYNVINSPPDCEYIPLFYSKILNKIYEYQHVQHNNKLIIATCYAKKYDQLSTYDIINMALSKGWTVELHCWGRVVNKIYYSINHDKFKMCFLDDVTHNTYGLQLY